MAAGKNDEYVARRVVYRSGAVHEGWIKCGLYDISFSHALRWQLMSIRSSRVKKVKKKQEKNSLCVCT